MLVKLIELPDPLAVNVAAFYFKLAYLIGDSLIWAQIAHLEGDLGEWAILVLLDPSSNAIFAEHMAYEKKSFKINGNSPSLS
jgi:hypothetical protein